MRLGIDAREIQDGVYTGIGRALANFLHYFSVQDNADSCVLFSTRKIPVDFGKKVSNVVIPEGITFIWDQWSLPQAIRKAGVDLFYSPYYKIPLLKPCTTVSAILDLMYIAYRPYYQAMSPWAKAYYVVFGRLFAHRSDKILTCSQYSKKDIERIYGVNKARIETIPLSVAPLYFSPQDPARVAMVKRKFNINGRYVLYMGNFKAHKNISQLVRAFAAIAREFSDVNLVLAGPQDHTYQELVNIIKSDHLTDRVIFTGKIMESDGPQYLYQGAEVFVMPALYEGFGLPPLEAMACGAPVIASNASCIPEIISEAGLLIDPNSTSEMANAVRKVLQDPVLKKGFIDKGLKRARDFETEKIAQEMYGFLKTLESPFDGINKKS